MHRPAIYLLGTIVNLFLLPHSYCSAYRIGDAVGILLRTHTPSAGSSTLEAYRHQLPRFGVSTKTRFDVSSLLNADDLRLSSSEEATRKKVPQSSRQKHQQNNEHLRLSLSFDEGFHHIPWLDVYNPTRHNERILQSLIITIVYSGSDGSIHAVHRETKYQDAPIPKGGRVYRDGSIVGGDKSDGSSNMPKSFTVEYIWINEADVDVQGGFLALFLAVLIVSLSSMVGACSSSAEDEYYGDQVASGGGSAAGKKKRYKEKHSSSSLGVGAGSSDGFAKSL